jgi:hypothetical protein
MSNADLFPPLLFKINEKQLALETAIMELTPQLIRGGRRQHSQCFGQRVVPTYSSIKAPEAPSHRSALTRPGLRSTLSHESAAP